ncbi:M1 family metallopeptidase [Amphiplicatus metriothermophilus]|uniref:Aminopeptidase N n=1 Tax=Amphiplicatus metriothermophilus TaxID=1519374 RepID=A0A239PQA6_9PROT|nr:M1 family metallopeptidase [Amphiplicatus metriothermophilus]MBB5518749.1 aminopeptidase N [Amphiplicatus metriothermophilus]SNT72096.1 Leukotriene A4 hydrolase, C-terminal [Amphiplicatus metriothermophilus]
MTLRYVAGALALFLAACTNQESAPARENAQTAKAERADPFTYANYDAVRATHLDLDLAVLFDEQTLKGTATLVLKRLDPEADTLVLDTNDLAIESVEAEIGGTWRHVSFILGEDDPALGSRLEIELPEDAERVRVAYRTSPGAAGLQWLSPAQTAGGVHPFMYSQNQTINARSMAPVQDTPAVRMTYSARLTTPPDLVALMSAAQDEGPRDGAYVFDMPQPVPAYLLAVAVGDLSFRAIDDRIGIYAEDDILAAAAAEFEDTPGMMEAAEALYGPYRWGRYDLLVLPPSFPFGGMENPRLSFLTPTLVAGDKSLTNVVAHELAHSWSGNLVTNATWRDAWLNEGFTSYVENRLMEALYGPERATMERALDLDSLKRTVANAERPALTQLKLPADLAHPDDAFSQVAYVKGAFFLKFLEERFGREAFDAFLRGYFDHFAFQSITTEDFETYLRENLLADDPEAVSEAELRAWLYEPGLPETIETPVSDAFEKVAAQQARWLSGEIGADALEVASWSAHEWLHFINTLPKAMTQEQFAALDARFGLTDSANAEIAFAWYMKAIPGGYEPAMPAIEDFLNRVGRGKFIYPLYTALKENGREDFARRVYAEARARYHPIAQRRIDGILG